MLVMAHTTLLGTVPPTNSPVSEEAQAAITTGQKLRSSGRFSEAVRAFETAARKAREAGDVRDQARALMYQGVCQTLTFQYRSALRTLDEASDLAVRAKDDTTGGAAAITLSALYSQLGDPSTAHRKIEQAVRLLQHSPRQEYLAEALVNLAEIQSDEGDIATAKKSFNDGISVAHQAGLTNLEARIQDDFGISLLLAGKTGETESALDAAYLLETRNKDLDLLAMTREHQAELELKKQNYAAALKLLNDAFSLPSPSFKTSPQYYPIDVRGKVLLGLGREAEALAAFRNAVDLASEWRQHALPGDATSTRTVVHLHNVYADYIELAADRAVRSHNSDLARQAFDVLAQNRAASLREQMALALDQQGRLPQRYFELLSELETAQERVTLGEKRNEDSAKLQSVRDELADLENKIGLATQNIGRQGESRSDKKSLRDIQGRLSASEVLLSFWLGYKKSFLWAVTESQVNLYELPSQSEIEQDAAAFTRALGNGSAPASAGQALSQALFSKLNRAAWSKKEWIIAGDGVLLNQVPFSALPSTGASAALQPILSTHAVRLVPSELLLTVPTGPPPQPRFVGIGDPIYNAADSRLVRNVTFSETAHPAIALGRLAGSAREIRSAADSSGLPETELLLGNKATIHGLTEALRSRPEILHIAVHVVSPLNKPGQAALALSLNKNNIPELLTSERIATFRVPGTLVVLSGCSSEQGEVLPGAGLMGLSRAWLLAGAAAVLVSAWPTPDDSGRFFASFYDHFRTSTPSEGPLAKRASAALQQAQLDMQHGRGYRSSPTFWAAYSVISKE